MVDIEQRAKDILEEYANYYSQVDLESLTKHLDQIISEAITEFEERLKEKAFCVGGYIYSTVKVNDIDQIAKEVKGEQ